jgi:polynucleotide 5'-kinase involved in rRNA processing
LRLPVSSRVSRRDPETRRFYREVRFRRYFQQAGELRLPWSSFTWEGLPLGQGWPLPPWRLRQLGQCLGVRVLSGVGQGRRAVLLTESTPPEPAAAESAGWPDWDQVHWLSWEGLQCRLTGLLDGRYRTLALGLILPGPWEREALALLTPLAPAAATQVRQVKLGKLRLNREGQELPQG